jgi:hypothetical protein
MGHKAGAFLWAALAAIGLAACDKASEESSQEFEAVELSVQEAVFGAVQSQRALVITLVDRQGVCGAIQAGALLREATALTFWLRDVGSSVAPGTYPVWGPGSWTAGGAVAIVDLTRTNAFCGSVLAKEQATPLGGQIVLASLDEQPGGRAVGHYQVLFATGTLEGDFDASWCEMPEDLQRDGLSCQ